MQLAPTRVVVKAELEKQVGGTIPPDWERARLKEDLGLSSLEVLDAVYNLERRLGVDLDNATLGQLRTARGLCSALQSAVTKATPQ